MLVKMENRIFFKLMAELFLADEEPIKETWFCLSDEEKNSLLYTWYYGIGQNDRR